MKKRQRIKAKVGLGMLLVATLALVMFPNQVWATDTDNDGFTDAEETAGITLPQGLALLNGSVFIPMCQDNEDPSGRALCVDPATPDLFVILVRATLYGATFTNIPVNPTDSQYFDPLEFISKPQADDGLGITTHEIIPENLNIGRSITPTQKAVRITESLNPTGNILGVANQGTPNGLDEATIFTERIKNHVYSVYAEAGAPLPSDVEATVIIPYIKQTIAHEIGHMTALAPDYNSRFGGYHYRSGSGVIMEQSVKYTVKKNNVTFYIPQVYARASQNAAALH